MGKRLGRDFSHVRVHADEAAAASAMAVNAEAFTVGRDLVFGHGRYAPGTRSGDRLIAHELIHVVQQAGHPVSSGPLAIVPQSAASEHEASEGRVRSAGAATALDVPNRALQRSPLSDSVKAAWTADPTLDALLARLTQSDVRGVADPDVDAEVARILTDPDDLWVAQRIRQGKVGDSVSQAGITAKGAKPKPLPVQAFFVRGAVPTRALVIAGVHGSEQQGMEVAERLVADLSTQQPHLTVIIVPSLFPHAAAAGTREGATPTNRNFPKPENDLAAATPSGTAPKDALGRTIMPENVMLLELIERFRPQRIISIHGTFAAGAAGVFFDPRQVNARELVGGLAERARGIWAGGEQRLPGESWLGMQRRLLREGIDRRRRAASAKDQALSEHAAVEVDTATTGIKGREKRNVLDRENDPPAAKIPKVERDARRAHPSVAGNVGPTGALDHATWSGGTPHGVSLGEYAPPRGISVFTVEPPVNARSDKYPGVEGGKITQADRKIELQAYADAVRTVLLGQ